MRLGACLLVAAVWVVQGDCASGPTVNLGYATYEGYYNDTFGLNVWKSVRYAAPPVGKLRWQAPQAPLVNNSQVTLAVDQPPMCPQTGAFGLPAVYGFNSGPGDEDCLYLNVYAAPNATNLPVLLWIHGGGYADFGAIYDPSVWINNNDNGFIVVEIQYRLGAFGYLASADVKNYGQLNVGFLDQRFALEWVQTYIAKFGGDPARVTVGGESSGAASAMFQALAYGGQDAGLFNNIIMASPYSPAIHVYNDTVPTNYYNDFAALAGCGSGTSQLNQYPSVFACLVAADTEVLQNASGMVSTTHGYFGTWTFLPVIDGDLIRERPSAQLSSRRVAGKRILVGNNANDGVPLFNPNVDTMAAYDSFVANSFPLFTAVDVDALNAMYQIQAARPGDDGVRFDTLGTSGPTALNQSEMATGIQQAVFDISAETVFDCPAQWLAEAFSNDSRQAWKYQFSVTPAYHGADLSAYFAVGAEVPDPKFRYAFQKILGSFIINDSPVITVADATGGDANSTVPVDAGGSHLSWPAFTLAQPWQMDLNTTGGTISEVDVTSNLSYYERTGPGIVNTFRLVNALTWEGGRGARCAFWRSVSARVPQ